MPTSGADRLAAHANAEGVSWPSTRRLAKLTGHSQTGVRDALVVLRDLGYIDGMPQQARLTRWRLVRDEGEQKRLRELRTHPAQLEPSQNEATAHPACAVETALAEPELRANCALTAHPGGDEGEVEELQRQHPLSFNRAAARGEGEEEEEDGNVHFNARKLVAFKRL